MTISNTFIYDAENKQIEVKNSSSVTIGQYWYDGDGKRVKKYVPATGETTVFIYDSIGRMVAEYSTIVAPQSTAKVSYLTTDNLGTPRINTDQNGQVLSKHDYHPFGEEIYTTQRTQGLNYTGGTVRQKFTSYERDIETDLDFAQNRYYFNIHGRFTTVDPTLSSVSFYEPQTWNRYVYVTNNPLRFVDPLGLWKLEIRIKVIKDEFTIDGQKISVTRYETEIVAVKTKDTDDANRLLKQLKIDPNSEEGKQLLAAIVNARVNDVEHGPDEVRLSTLGGEVGSSFELFESAVTAQKMWDIEKKKQGPPFPGFSNCAEACLRLAFPGGSIDDSKIRDDLSYTDSKLKDQKNISQSETRFLDAVRYADGKNNATHFANVVFETDEGKIQIFSRNGNGGRFGVDKANILNNTKYGTIRGVGNDKTGYYSRTQKRK